MGEAVPAKYEVVLQELSATIAGMKPAEQLPTEQQLAEQFQVSSMTVRRALEVLTNSGRIVGIRGKGTFVAEPSVTKRMTLASFTDSMKGSGRVARAEVLSASLTKADLETADRFGLTEGSSIYRLERLRFGDDVPLCIDRSELPADRFPGLLGNDLSGSLYEILRRRYGVELSRAESRVSALLPAPEDAALLEIETWQPCMRVIARGSTVDGAVAEITTSVFRGDLYELLIEPAS
jgi:GntR family transcriptional regulator